MSNILDAVINIVKSPIYNLKESHIKSNRANSMGDALEKYVVDSFADTLIENDEQKRLLKISEIFSYIGNDSNPPDAMLKGGAGIETKKIQSRNSQLQLNSSYPKSKLLSSDPKLCKSAIQAEIWDEKDFIYAVGYVKGNELEELALIDASLYCADDEIYSTTFDAVKIGISTSIPSLDFSSTKELGRLNKVDPLGITKLRIRGMWLIENPFFTFKDLYQPNENYNFNLFTLVSTDKYNNFDNKNILEQLESKTKNLLIKDVIVKNPNNPAQYINSKLITFCHS